MRLSVLLVLLVSGCVVMSSPGQQAAVVEPELEPILEEPKAVDPTIPTPASVIGHEIGVGAVRYEPLVRYLHALADASPNVTLTPYTESHEGRTLYYLTVTSEENHARLEDTRDRNAKLADPRKLQNAEEARAIIEDLPGVAWLAYSIHGDELSSTDAALMVAYQLAAGTDDSSRRMRSELVVHIDPLMNPDGRERYLQQLQHLTGKVDNPDYQAMQHSGLWSAGRGNHYLFDLNRDWLMQVHPETRGRAEAILQWNPHLVVDSHEMGSLDTYLFDPPREPYNIELSEDNLLWRRRFSADQAQAFDRHGWSYYTRGWYEEWYPGYTNAWSNLLGAIGLLYEQAGVNGAAVKQPSGRTLTYRESVHHHFVSSLANLESLRSRRKEVLSDFHADREWAVSEHVDEARYFVLPRATDGTRQAHFVALLQRQGIETAVATEPFEARGVTDVWGHKADNKMFAKGATVIDALQPHRRLLSAILRFDPHMSEKFTNEERKELENRRSSRLYDTTSWNLGMAYGLDAFWVDDAAGLKLAPVQAAEPAELSVDASSYGYLIDGHDSEIYRAMVRLMNAACKVRVAAKPFIHGGRKYDAGTCLLRNHENSPQLAETLRKALTDLDVDLEAVNTALSDDGPDLGGQRFELLEQPRIAVASQWPISTSSFGATWHLLDARLNVRSSPINIQRLGRIDLRRYNVLVLPHAGSSAALGSVLNEKVLSMLKRWVEAGGTLIAYGGSAAFLADQQHGLSNVRLRRDVLEQLSLYEENLERETAAREIKVDLEEVWSTGADADEENDKTEGRDMQKKEKTNAKPDLEALKRKDEWQRMFSPRGVFVAAHLDRQHWLCFGLPERLPVYVSGSTVLMSAHPVRSPVRLAERDDLRLSGLLWPEARERHAGSAYATTERLGRGQVILFATDPFFRGFLEGSGRLLQNALLLAPGFGTSQPVPW